MIKVTRHSQNPILTPDEDIPWQATAVFNGCLVKDKGLYHCVFRAISEQRRYYEHDLEISQIGYTLSRDGVNFDGSRLLITPEYNWEQFGCEDPRVTKFNNRYYIFYTALEDYPHTEQGIKIGVVITKDFKEILFKHQVTHFNSKAMALFPEKVNGRMTAILTVNPDKKPAKIALYSFDKDEDLWTPECWQRWLERLNEKIVPFEVGPHDHLEVGPPPLKTKKGWLLVYSYIKNYLQPPPTFGIEAVLLDLKDPTKILGRTPEPLLVPEQEYELYGKVPKVIFPSGALIEGGILRIYYGAADTVFCLAEVGVDELVNQILGSKKPTFRIKKQKEVRLEKFSGNPIIKPIKKHVWESKYTFNPAAVYEEGKVHLLYRAMGEDETSVFGYASSHDGLTINERSSIPVYLPRADFEKKVKPGYSGCEDPRISRLKDKYYVCYTAYDGANPTKIALSSIKVKDFLSKKWRWTLPKNISCPRRSDKNAGLFPEKYSGQYVFFHRIGGCIWLDHVRDLSFKVDDWVGGKMIVCPQPGQWDSKKIGIAGPPMKTKDGWLVIYHGLSNEDNQYRLGAMLLSLQNPDDVLAKLPYPIIEPTQNYEKNGLRPNTVFSCGSVIIKGKLFVYYGAADEVVAVATVSLEKLLGALKLNPLPVGSDG